MIKGASTIRPLRSVLAGSLLTLLLLWGGAGFGQVFDAFEIEDIRLQGLQRVSAGTVFNDITLDVGDTADKLAVRSLVRELFGTGYFEEIDVLRDDANLIIRLVERPSIAEITIEGEKAVQEDALLDGLAAEGLQEGEIFKQSTLERVKTELIRLYVAQGKYAVSIETKINELPRNRVAIEIVVDEGKNASIRQITFVGNETYSSEELKAQMELKEPTIIGAFKGQHRYSREKMQGDLESIESYYRDRGFVEFRIESTQISMTPDRKQVFITLNVIEGDRHVIDQVDLVGELDDIEPELLRALILVKKDDIYSNALVTATEQRIVNALSTNGYTFATASGLPEVKEGGLVDIKFQVDTGKRAYVRKLSFIGNAVTQDHVLRREMRQMERGWASTGLIELSKVRLERLGFFKDVTVETPEVPGSDDEIDVEISVNEESTGSITFGFSYQQLAGLGIQAGFEKANLAGTGKNISFGLNWNDYQKSLSYTFTNPYFTADGISRGMSLYISDTDYGVYNLNQFSTRSVGGGAIFGFPIGETRRLQFSAQAELTDISEGNSQADEILDFVSAEGSQFLNFKLEGNWQEDARNRAIFATRGHRHSVSMELALPGSDLSFYKLQFQNDLYVPTPHPEFTLHFRTALGYGATYGDTQTFPFYEHFFAGGFGSVRGYERSSLGPRSLSTGFYTGGRSVIGRPFGGNVLAEISTELIFPIPFVDLPGSMQTVAFVDGGNVFNTNCPEANFNCFGPSIDELRWAAGISVSLITQFAPMSFAIAFPFNTGPYDEEESFSFDLTSRF